MPRQASVSLWPFSGLLVCLFVLSLCATRSWRHVESADQSELAPIAAISLPEAPISFAGGDQEEQVDIPPPQAPVVAGDFQLIALRDMLHEVEELFSALPRPSFPSLRSRTPPILAGDSTQPPSAQMPRDESTGPFLQVSESVEREVGEPDSPLDTGEAPEVGPSVVEAGDPEPLARHASEAELLLLQIPADVADAVDEGPDELATTQEGDDARGHLALPIRQPVKQVRRERSVLVQRNEGPLQTVATGGRGGAPQARQRGGVASSAKARGVEDGRRLAERDAYIRRDGDTQRDVDTQPAVKVTDESDRLAVRPRLFPKRNRIGPAEPQEAAAPPAAETDRFAWLHVEPKALLAELAALENSPSPQVAQWAGNLHAAIEDLSSDPPAMSADVTTRLTELRRLADAASQVTDRLPPRERDRVQLARAAVNRRLGVLTALAGVDSWDATWQIAGNRLMESVRRLRSHLGDGTQSAKWSEYLLLDELVAAWEVEPPRDDKHLRHLIERISDRLENADLTEAQRAVFASAPFADLRRSFGVWAAATVDLEILCKAIEAYEQRGGELCATRIAADARLLSLSPDKVEQRAAEAIDRQYRSANIRLAVTSEFLQRMIPEQPLLAEPVRDTIAGAAVSGRSLTASDVRVMLVPDPHNWRLGLQVTGDVSASTASTSGPATLHSAARTEYLARKLIVLTPAGLYSFPAVAGAEADNMLRAIDTSFDGIPLIEGLVRSIVIGQHEKSQRQAMAEVESKVSRKARQRLDSQLDERLVDVAGRVRKNVLAPLGGLDLRPETMSLQTTAERLTTRVRLASPRQLAAHTPRPLALSDSLLSVQVHQSMLNNLVEQLDLTGREVSLPELYKEVAAKFNRLAEPPADLSRTARVHFARRDPIVVEFKDGRVRVTLSLRQVQDGRRSFHNFKVHAYYRPQARGLAAQLMRDGIIEIDGQALTTGDYVILQGVFVSLFSDSRPFSLVSDERSRDPRLAGLMITQLALGEGWLGLALGPEHPQRAALMSRTVR